MKDTMRKLYGLIKGLFRAVVWSRKTWVARLVMMPLFILLLPVVLIAVPFLLFRKQRNLQDPTSEYLYPMF